METCILAIPAVAQRIDLLVAPLASCLTAPFVHGALVSIQSPEEIPLDRLMPLKLLGGMCDKQVTVIQQVGTRGIAQNRQHLLERGWGDWMLFCDDDVVAYQGGPQALWEARHGYEAVTGIVHLPQRQAPADSPRAAYPDGFATLDHLWLARRDVLRQRGGFLPATSPGPHPPSTGEDLLASFRLKVKAVQQVVGAEIPAPSTWQDAARGSLDYVTYSIHALNPGL